MAYLWPVACVRTGALTRKRKRLGKLVVNLSGRGPARRGARKEGSAAPAHMPIAGARHGAGAHRAGTGAAAGFAPDACPWKALNHRSILPAGRQPRTLLASAHGVRTAFVTAFGRPTKAYRYRWSLV